VNVLVQVQRLTGGARKVASVTEVSGMEGDIITMQDIFSFEQLGVSDAGKTYGQFVATGIRPSFLDRLKATGCNVDIEMFTRRVLMTDEGE
jgi:pilus assembly protein CpaF